MPPVPHAAAAAAVPPPDWPYTATSPAVSSSCPLRTVPRTSFSPRVSAHASVPRGCGPYPQT